VRGQDAHSSEGTQSNGGETVDRRQQSEWAEAAVDDLTDDSEETEANETDLDSEELPESAVAHRLSRATRYAAGGAGSHTAAEESESDQAAGQDPRPAEAPQQDPAPAEESALDPVYAEEAQQPSVALEDTQQDAPPAEDAPQEPASAEDAPQEPASAEEAPQEPASAEEAQPEPVPAEGPQQSPAPAEEMLQELAAFEEEQPDPMPPEAAPEEPLVPDNAEQQPTVPEAAAPASVPSEQPAPAALAEEHEEFEAPQAQEEEPPANEPEQPAPMAEAAAPVADAGPDDSEVLTVGRGIRLVAKLCECTELLVEGHLEATARARELQVAKSGRFIGSAEVEYAEIHGHFEGSLTVSKKLYISATGSVSGTTRYQEIVIEAGGQVMGNAQRLHDDGEADAEGAGA
jgi:cytoskeletal protein CcmA (bactofilin family)